MPEAYRDAYVTNHQFVIFDTGTERIDLTTRVQSGGWSRTPEAAPIEYDPLTRQARYRIGAPPDTTIAISGMYYGPEVAKVREVRTAKEAFVLAMQFREHPVVNLAANPRYFMGGHVVTESIGVDGTGPLLTVPTTPLRQREPLVYGEDWERKAAFAAAHNTATERVSTTEIEVDFSAGLPVLLYDIDVIEAVDGETPVLEFHFDNELASPGNIHVRIDIPHTRARAGFIDLAQLEFSDSSVATGGDAAASLTDWPDSGTWALHIRAAQIQTGELDIGFGVGERISAD